MNGPFRMNGLPQAAALPARSVLRLLTSAKVIAEHGSAIKACAAQYGVGTELLSVAEGQQQPDQVDAAFFSRDLYEGSSLRVPGALSNAFFEVVDKAPKLQWLHVCSSGLDLPQYASALQRGIAVTSSKGAMAKPIAQTAAAAIAAISRGFMHWLQQQAQGQWQPLVGQARPKDIGQQRLVILGAGEIGQELARITKAMGFETIGIKRQAAPLPHFDAVLDWSQLDVVLPCCDWLAITVPLTAQTQGLIDRRRLALLPPHACLANVARGEIVDEPALIEALQTKALAAAYLDVFATEPLPADSPLWHLPNVWLSPHNSAASTGQERAVVDKFLQHYEARLRTA